MVGVLLLILATSLDGFSAGIAYGLRGIGFPMRARLIAASVSVAALALAAWTGRTSGESSLRPWPAPIGGVLLLALGLWTATKAFTDGGRFPGGLVMTWRIRSLGFFTYLYDFKRNSNLSHKE